jgi:phenylacetate-CoA ligase
MSAAMARSGRDSRPRLRSWLHGSVVYPAAVRLRGEGTVFENLEELRRAERLGADALQRRQRTLLADQLNYAFGHCSFYRRRWGDRATFEPSYDLESRIADLPLLSKRDLQEHCDELAAQPSPARVSRKTTGGSTGRPVTVLKDAEALAWERAASWLGYGWYGIRPGDRGVRFWGSPTRHVKRRVRFALADLAMNRTLFSAFAFTERDLERYWARCLRLRPAYFYGYTSMLEALGRHVMERPGPGGRSLNLKAVIATAEVLTEPQRDLMQEAFGAPVKNEYGCGEVGAIAYECERSRLHVLSENVYLEVLRPDGTAAELGEPGEVVVTDLRNRAMPLVRYQLDDFAVSGERCDCGRGLPTILNVFGREYDFVQAADGRRFHGEYWMYLFEDLRESGLPIGQFKVVQTEPDRVEIQLEMSRPLTLDDEQKMRQAIGRDLSSLNVDVRQVGEIERAPSGKMRVVEQRMEL